jgi:hypothetical protein
MDILYILGTGSTWKDNELRYSLRSVEKNIVDSGNVFIVGEKPDWLQNVYHISFPDAYQKKWCNVYSKLTRACKSPALSSDFLLFNDDFFILQPIKAENYPFYFSSIMATQNSFLKTKVLTTPEIIASLMPKSHGPVRNFSVHRPVRINKKKYAEMPQPDLTMAGYCGRNYYCNFYNVPGIQCPDVNISPNMTISQIERLVANRTDISIFSDTARRPSFQEWINKKFPSPSTPTLFEKI